MTNPIESRGRAVVGRRAFVGGLAAALGSAGCGVVVRGVQSGVIALRDSTLFHRGRHGELTERERSWAKTAWRYFENNYQAATGLVNSMDRYPVATMWHTGDHLAAMIAARELDVLSRRDFDHRLGRLLHTLNVMPLFLGRVPNTVYATASGTMANYAAQPDELGWSAVDVGRLLVWLAVARARYPEFAEYVDRAVLRWNFCDLLDRCGRLRGGARDGEGLRTFDEGRLGYEEYAAMGYRAWGFGDARATSQPGEAVRIHDIELPRDHRDPRTTGVYAPVVTLPHVLLGLEFNWDLIDDERTDDTVHSDTAAADLAERVYRVQEARYRREGILTARTDHPLVQPPYFVFDAVFVAGYPWNTIADDGSRRPQAALVSTRAVFGLWALWKTPFTDRLLEVIESVNDPGRGWYEGRLELTGGLEEAVGATTNAIVLEALLHKASGKIYRTAPPDGRFAVLVRDEFRRPRTCLPPERDACPTPVASGR